MKEILSEQENIRTVFVQVGMNACPKIIKSTYQENHVYTRFYFVDSFLNWISYTSVARLVYSKLLNRVGLVAR